MLVSFWHSAAHLPVVSLLPVLQLDLRHVMQQSCLTFAPGMQPLAVDWREKLKGSRKGGSKGAATRSPPNEDPSLPASHAIPPDSADDSSMTADGKPNLELLSKGLPAGWRAMWDKNTGDIYYGNLKSRVRVGGRAGIAFLCICISATFCIVHCTCSLLSLPMMWQVHTPWQQVCGRLVITACGVQFTCMMPTCCFLES